jgi:hypothetical protein
VEAAERARPSPAGPVYTRRQPESETQHRLVCEHLRTLYAAVEHGFEGASLPEFVRAHIEGYVNCGALNRGFAHLQCEDCQHPLLVAFSCGSRGFCPSCPGRRMCQGSLNLPTYVLPESAPTQTSPAPQAHTMPPAKPARTGARCRYWPWAELMRLILGLPVDTCPHRVGRMKLRALVRDPESIERFLRHQNQWTEPLGLAEARPPPYLRSITRLKPTRQVELFE